MNNTFLDVVTIICGFALGLMLGISVTKDFQHNEATQTECARYHPETGEFEWIKGE